MYERMFLFIGGIFMSRLIFHIDVNSAYLSWEAVYRLQLGAIHKY